jgi:hypothetical protein
VILLLGKVEGRSDRYFFVVARLFSLADEGGEEGRGGGGGGVNEGGKENEVDNEYDKDGQKKRESHGQTLFQSESKALFLPFLHGYLQQKKRK